MFHSGIVDAQELVGGSQHVDTVRLALGTFLVHELIHRLLSRRTGGWYSSPDTASCAEQRSHVWRCCGCVPPPGQTSTAGVYIRKGHQCLLGVETAHITNFRHELGARAGSTPNIPITTVSRRLVFPSARTVHVHSQYRICNWNPSFSRYRFNLLDDVNSRLNLLNPTAATRGWMTVFFRTS